MSCDHGGMKEIDTVEAVGSPRCLRVTLFCEGCGAEAEVLVEVEDLPQHKIKWVPARPPRPESCEACHCQGDFEWVEADGDGEKEPWNPAGWCCRACGQIHVSESYNDTHSGLRNAGTCVGGDGA